MNKKTKTTNKSTLKRNANNVSVLNDKFERYFVLTGAVAVIAKQTSTLSIWSSLSLILFLSASLSALSILFSFLKFDKLSSLYLSFSPSISISV